MARKHPNPIDNPPAASSGEEEEEEEVVEEEEEEEMQSEEEPLEVEGEEEEEEEEVEEEEEEEEDDDDNKAELKTEKIHPQPSKSTPDPQEEEDDDESESDSDPTSPGVSGFTIKEHSKPPKTEDNSSPVLVSCKRPAETNSSRSVAKKAKSENGGGEDKKKPTSIRLWSEADEIAILKALIDFHQDRRVDPTSDSIEFYEFVQDSLSVESSKNQVMDKVRRLKKKYMNNAAKAQNGKDPVFSRPHEHKSFHISKQIWGGHSTPKMTPSGKKKNPATDNGIATTLLQEEPVVPVCNNNDQACNHARKFSQLYPFLHLSLSKCNFFADMVSKHGADAMASSLRCLNKSELEQLEEDWKHQILAESELFSKRVLLLQKQIKLIRYYNSQRG